MDFVNRVCEKRTGFAKDAKPAGEGLTFLEIVLKRI
jgi:hypothetical protein